jgi:hypothetical protein
MSVHAHECQQRCLAEYPHLLGKQYLFLHCCRRWGCLPLLVLPADLLLVQYQLSGAHSACSMSINMIQSSSSSCYPLSHSINAIGPDMIQYTLSTIAVTWAIFLPTAAPA